MCPYNFLERPVTLYITYTFKKPEILLIFSHPSSRKFLLVAMTTQRQRAFVTAAVVSIGPDM